MSTTVYCHQCGAPTEIGGGASSGNGLVFVARLMYPPPSDRQFMVGFYGFLLTLALIAGAFLWALNQ